MVLLEIATRNLLHARRRTALLGTAIGMVTALLVVMLAVADGIEDNLVRAATTISSGHVNVGGFYKTAAGEGRPVVVGAGRLRALVESRTPGLDYVVDRQRGWAKLISPTSSLQAGLIGLDASREERFFDLLAVAGGDPHGLSAPRTIVVFESQARRLGVAVGDAITVQTETLGGHTNTADATIVAIARDVGLLSAWAAYMPQPDLRALYGLQDDTTGALWLYLEDIDDAEPTMMFLRGLLAAEGFAVMEHQPVPFYMKFETVNGEDWTGQRIDVTTWSDEVSFLTWVLTAFDTVTWFLVVILVAIIAVGIMNTLWAAVRERTGEIGTLRALGMSRARVLWMVLLEALVLGLGATTAGALAGAGLALAVNAAHLPVPVAAMQAILLSDTLRLSVRPASLLTAIAALTAFTGLAALWPAQRAASLRPITAIARAE